MSEKKEEMSEKSEDFDAGEIAKKKSLMVTSFFSHPWDCHCVSYFKDGPKTVYRQSNTY